MTDFYKLTPPEQSDRFKKLAAKALESWDIRSNPTLDLISHRENAVYKVETAEARYALRVHRWNYHTDNELRSELQWMEALSQSGIDTPEIIHTQNSEPFVVAEVEEVPEPRQVDLFGWVNGIPISDLTEKGDELIMHQNIGELMAQLHNQATEWIPPKNFTRHAWDTDGLLGENPVWGRFWEMKHFSQEEREKIQQVRSVARQHLQELDQGPETYGLIHCDFLPQNLLKDGEIVRVIDFDDCGYGWHLFDIVTSLFSYTYLPNFKDIKKAFIQGYRAFRELTDDQLSNFDFFMLLRLMTSCGWLHTRPETETAQLYGEGAAKSLVAAVNEFLTGN
jgi:Ser/Thr protein kinase RdoA (MazF antagonist)